MKRRTLGVEEELLLVDPLTGRPVAGIEEVRAAARRADHEPAQRELTQQQAEIASAPFRSAEDVLQDLRGRRADVVAAAAERRLAVVASATSPLAVTPKTTSGERYEQVTERFGLMARQQLTCGMHTHVSISSAAEGVAVIDGIRPWLHVLIALTANSPYWQGEDSGYASYRTLIWGQFPTAGPTGAFGSEDVYRAVVADLLASGTILDEGMIYFDARLSQRYPTVEIRVADVCTDPRDGVVAAALARALVDAAAVGDPICSMPVRTEVLRVAAWGAARWGLTGDLLDPVAVSPRSASEVLSELLDALSPHLRANGDLSLVTEGVDRLLGPGPTSGAQLQRAALEQYLTLAGVVADLVRRTSEEVSRPHAE